MKCIKEIITSKAFFRNYFLVCSTCIGMSIANIYSDYKEVPSSITLEEAEKKNLLKQNPAKEELLQAVKENRNIKEEYKQIFNRYIEKFCEEKEHIDKAILYQNIKDLQEIKIISKEELEKQQNEFTVMAISKRKKIIYIREDLYKKYKKALKELMKEDKRSDKENVMKKIGYLQDINIFENKFFHEITHLSNQIIIEDEKGSKYEINGRGSHIIQEEHIMEQMTEDIANDIYKDETETCLYLDQNMDLLKLIIGESYYENIFYYEGISKLNEILENKNKNISVVDFIRLSYEQQVAYYELIKAQSKNIEEKQIEEKRKRKEQIDLELYKIYIDYMLAEEELQKYIDFEQEIKNLKVAEDVQETLYDYLNEYSTKEQKRKQKTK